MEYIQVDQARRIEDGFDSLELHLCPALHTKLCQELIGMASMERFQASFSYHQWLSVYQVQARQLNGTMITQTPSQVNPHGASSITADADGEVTNGDYYAPSNSADTIIFVPEQLYNVLSSASAHSVADWGSDLAGVGAQFDSYPYQDHAASFFRTSDPSGEGKF
jgi:hypothetical protein